MGYLMRGRIPDEKTYPLNRFLIAVCRPLLNRVLAVPKLTLVAAAVVLVARLWPLQHIGGKFMPPLDEADLLYMPSALPGLSVGKAGQAAHAGWRCSRVGRHHDAVPDAGLG